MIAGPVIVAGALAVLGARSAVEALVLALTNGTELFAASSVTR